MNRFIESSPVVTTNNYYTIPDLHNLQSLHTNLLATLHFPCNFSGPQLKSSKVKVKVRVALRLAVYRQSVRLGVKPLETHDQTFFLQLNSCGNSPYVASSLTRRWVCLSQICLVFRRVYISHI
jgi:hypothetical protein